MITIDQIQEYAMSQSGKLTAVGIAAIFVLLICIEIFSAISFFITENHATSINQMPTVEQTHAVDLSTLHIFGLYEPKNVNPNELPEATLDIKLNGVFVAVPAKFSQAVLTAPGEKQKVYYVGDELPGNAKLYQVLDNSVIIQYNGQLQKLSLPESNIKFGKKPRSLDLQKQ